MDELIFFAVIIFFSIVESIARSRKAKRKQAEGGGEPDPTGMDFEWAQNEPELPTYDSEPSYDDLPSYDDQIEQDEVRRAYGGEDDRAGAKSSSETLLPGDLLAQLAGMAGKLEAEREKARTIALPKQSPPLPTQEPEEHERQVRDRAGRGEQAAGARGDRSGRAVTRTRTPVPARSRTPRSGTPARSRTPRAPVEHSIHLSHAGYGTDPSERAKSEQDDLDPLREFLSEDAKAIRAQLMSQSESALRQAFILSEVLGPPVSMRDDD